MLRRRLLCVGVLLTLAVSGLAQEAAQYSLELKNAVSPLAFDHLARVQLRVNYRRAEAGKRVYILLVPLDGKAAVVGTARLKANDVKLNICGQFGSGGENPYRIATANFPISLSMKATKFFGSMGYDPEMMGFGPDSKITFTFGFIATIAEAGDGTLDSEFSLTPSAQSEYYDGLLLVPFEVTLKEGTDSCALFDSTRMNAVGSMFTPVSRVPVRLPRARQPE